MSRILHVGEPNHWSCFALFGVVLLVVMLAACSSTAPLPTAPLPTAQSVTAVPPTQETIRETSISDDSTLGLSRLYDAATLEYWGGRYQRSTNKILDEVIWPALLSDEKRRFGSRPAIEFPLWAEGKVRQHPLAFYVPSGSNRIVFPVFSLKFLDDLCTAYAWLQINGYSLQTISEYTAILKYGKSPPEGFLPPLEALKIPANALDDPEVDELALGHFVTARTFIILHEMGHVLYGHNKARIATPAESVLNEQQADLFAATVMQRTPLPPLGILVFFLADAHWSDFPAAEHSTHPLTGQRVSALADHVDDPSLAQRLRELGRFLDDSDIRAGFVATGKAGDLTALGPRRVNELPPLSTRSIQERCDSPFNGTYRGEIVQYPEPESMMVEMRLKRQNNHISGLYTFGLGIGTIEGTVVGRQLYFGWDWSDNYGKGVFNSLEDGSFAGTWGYRENQAGAGTWNGQCVAK